MFCSPVIAWWEDVKFTETRRVTIRVRVNGVIYTSTQQNLYIRNVDTR